MRRKLLFPAFLLLFLLSSTVVYAETNIESVKTETITWTEELRYDPVYYQEPVELYPVVSDSKARSVMLSLEEYVVDALENLQTQISVSVYQIPREEASELFFQILNNHPSIFYVSDSIRVSYNSSGIATSYIVSYTDTKENIQLQQDDFNREVEQALTWVDSSMTDTEKALVVHDYLVLECEYDYERLEKNTLPDSSFTAYGALVGKMAVCDGYARAYSCILNELGISNTIVSSDSMNHAWNQVCINQTWYHVDVTWDDPVWDCIGRVGHNYFLLSDRAISDSEHEHGGWSSGYTAGSTMYDETFWSEITSAFCYYNGAWYYSSYNAGTGKTSLVKRTGSLLEAAESVIYTVEQAWNNYLNGFMYLDLNPTNSELYFNTRTEIMKLDAGGTCTAIHEPECQGSQLIFGFTIRDAQLCYALQSTPNNTNKQVVSTYTVEEWQLQKVTGITAENREVIYDGTAKQIQVEGTLQGDRITYKHEDGIYRQDQPEMINAGTYQVYYKVERDGYEAYIGYAYIVIQMAATNSDDIQSTGTVSTTTPTKIITTTTKTTSTTTTTTSAPAKVKLVSVKKKGNTKAKLTWKKAKDADGYVIYMRTGKGKYKKIKTIKKGNKVTFTRSGLKKGKKYRFRIRAYKKAGNNKTYGSYSIVKTLKI